MRILLALLVTLLTATPAAAGDPSWSYSSVMSAFAAKGPFSGSVLVTERGRVLFERAYGLADREKSAANTPQSRFQIGSISKWFTVVAALKLVDAGKLSVDAPISRYLPEYPRAIGDRIIVGDVLSNMSGLKDRLPTQLINDPQVSGSRMSTAEATLVYAEGPLVSEPGTAFDYAHTNWVLAQAIIEAASGEPLEALLTRSIFEPLSLRDTGVTHGSFAGVRNGSIPYASDAADAARELHILPGFLIPTGTLYSNSRDLARMAHAVYETRMLSPASLVALTTIRYAPEGYALGGRVRHETLGAASKTLAFEIGSSGGFKALVVHVIGDDVTVVLLNNTNMSQDDLAALSESLLAKVYGDAAARGSGRR